MRIMHETILEININRLKSNFKYLKGKLKAKTKIIAVMKAYAYGHGDIVLGKKLEEFGVHGLWVADFEEGSRLRESGIQIPIIIANPGAKSTQKIIENKLEVVIYNFETKKFRTLFNEQLQKENFKTLNQGLSHIFNDGALMVEEQNHGRIILFNNQGEKEWEFVNKDKNGDIGSVGWSRIIEDELFIEQFKSLVENKKCTN